MKLTMVGINWYDLTNGMEISQIYRIGVSQNLASAVICGLQDNGAKRLSNSQWYEENTFGDGMECIYDYTDPLINYESGPNGLISKTTDAGANWSAIILNNGIGKNEKGAWVTPYIMHPTNHDILFLGKSQVYQTTNGGSSWNSISPTLARNNLRSMAIAPSNPNYIYSASLDTLFFTNNGGTN